MNRTIHREKWLDGWTGIGAIFLRHRHSTWSNLFESTRTYLDPNICGIEIRGVILTYHFARTNLTKVTPTRNGSREKASLGWNLRFHELCLSQNHGAFCGKQQWR
jgi:hypothetical protein